MDIPDSVDSVFLTEETLLDIASRTGLSTLALYDRLMEDRNRGVKSCYVFSRYDPPRSENNASSENPNLGGLMDYKDAVLKDVRERPVETGLAIGTMALAAVTAAAKVIELIASARSKNAYAKSVKSRTAKKK